MFNLHHPTWPLFLANTLATLEAALAKYQEPGHILRQHRRAMLAALAHYFNAGLSVQTLISGYTAHMDQLLERVWQTSHGATPTHCSLIALGGYGRGELHPYSDLDLLILIPDDSPLDLHAIELFIQRLWDTGLEIGHSVRTLPEALALCRKDLEIMTHTVDARLLLGNTALFADFKAATAQEKMWSMADFFKAKQEERKARHKKYAHTAYKLEPNVKNSPGGLRDLHHLIWISKRYYGAVTINDLLRQTDLQPKEYAPLKIAKDFLDKVRFTLHILTGRKEDRLLFDYQRQIAPLLGYQDAPHQLAIEQFMHDYFKAVKMAREINDILLQYFVEVLLEPKIPTLTPINERFQLHNEAIEVCHPQVFANDPSTILEMFLLMAKTPRIRGVRAQTIRLVRQYRHRIDESYHTQSAYHPYFLELLRQPSNISIQLQRMNRYGLLEKYIPAFATAIGRMQYDLYHVYTVDQHSLFVARNIYRFKDPRYRGEFSLGADIFETISHPEVLYLAALFHDVAKGRGGHHDELGAQDAKQFCEQLALPTEDTQLVEWLVRHHLLMSRTAQRLDIYDPDTVITFATAVKDQRHLDHIYLLTVADICATNPTLWNQWRNKLFTDLYHFTKQLLAAQQKVLNKTTIIHDKKQRALDILSDKNLTNSQIHTVWEQFRESYFYRETPHNIATHTQAIIEHGEQTIPLVMIMHQGSQEMSEIFCYHRQHGQAFINITVILSNSQLNIQEARIFNTHDHYSLSTYIVTYPEQFELDWTLIQSRLQQHLSFTTTPPRLVQRRLGRHLRTFKYPTECHFRIDEPRQCTVLEVTTSDRPGFLASLAYAFHAAGVILLMAKIATLGERIEDVFYITDAHGQPISPEQQQKLQKLIQ
jgi:[protein-PII] uridylyltransferase